MEPRNDVAADEQAGLWTALDYEELCALKWIATHHRERLNEAGLARLRELHTWHEHLQKQQDDEHTREWGRRLSPAKQKEVERRLAAGEALTYEQLQMHVAGIRLTQPRTSDEAAWDRWYETPISKMLFATSRPALRPQNVRPHGRRPRRRTRVRAPAGSDADDEPAPPRAATRSICPGCGEEFSPRRPNQRYHDSACRQRAFYHRQRSGPTDALERYRDEVWEARRSGAIDPEEALELLVDPKPHVLAMLAEPAAA